MALLDLGRSGARLAGIVLASALLLVAAGELTKIAAPLLVLQGTRDVVCPMNMVSALVTEMDHASNDLRMVLYGQTGHAFYNPEAGDRSEREARFFARSQSPLSAARRNTALPQQLERLRHPQVCRARAYRRCVDFARRFCVASRRRSSSSADRKSPAPNCTRSMPHPEPISSDPGNSHADPMKGQVSQPSWAASPRTSTRPPIQPATIRSTISISYKKRSSLSIGASVEAP